LKAPFAGLRATDFSTSRDHAIFGGCLRSEIPLPELPLTTSDGPDWTFRRARQSRSPSEFLGEETVDPTLRVRCSRLPDGFRLDFDDTGIFDIVEGGQVIEWTAGRSPSLELVRADLLGGVFSLVLHLQGLLCLHSSAVVIADGALAFLAQKGTGKSTLASALCAVGATLVTDDLLPIHPAEPVTAWPSMPAVRLLPDSASHLGYARRSTHPTTGKYHVNALPQAQIEMRRVPLAALYELVPVPPSDGVRAARRIRVNGAAAVATLLRHIGTGTAVGSAEAMNLFSRAADVARSVPVYRLEIVRDFARLPEVVEQINEWH
jgi:hypothetical protein